MEKTKIQKAKAKINKTDIIFYSILLAWPILQFCIFYVGVNFNSIIMSFKQISIDSELNWVVKFPTLVQYSGVFSWFKSADFRSYLGVSLSAFFITTAVSVPLGLLFAYYIFKKLPFWGAFRVILYLPQILSGVVVAAIVRYFISKALPHIIPAADKWLSATSEHAFAIVMIYNVFVSFGVNVLMYSNKMAGISEEIIESAHLDGATGLKEFWYIVLPLTFSTVSVFLITAVAGICVNQYGVYDMFAGKAGMNLKGIGYWFFVDVANKFKDMVSPDGAANLPYYSAIGVTLTVITVPIALFIRWALEKFGPSED